MAKKHTKHIKNRFYTVKQLADLSHVSVRTLHYYDETDLLKPAEIKQNGYRIYAEAELLRLQQILFFKELEFPLEQIKEIIDSPHFDHAQALQDHKKQLEQKSKRLHGLIETINKTITNMKNQKINDDELFDAFDDKQMQEYQKEAKERWGHTDAWKQSQERMKGLSKKEIEEKVKERDGDMMERIAEAYLAGEKPGSDISRALMARHRHSISLFYDVDATMHRNLADMYIADPRFAAYYDKFAPGLSQYMHDAIYAYCEKEGK